MRVERGRGDVGVDTGQLLPTGAVKGAPVILDVAKVFLGVKGVPGRSGHLPWIPRKILRVASCYIHGS